MDTAELKKRLRNTELWCAAALVALSFALVGSISNDIWFLLNSGRYLLAHGLPGREPFTIHQDLAFQMQQWLTCAVFWLLYEKAGFIGLMVLVNLVHALQTWVLYRICILVSGGKRILSSLILWVYLILVWITGFERPRPWIFSFFLLTVQLWVQENYAQSGRKRWLLWLPLLSVLQINFHTAMWPMMLAFMAPYLLDFKDRRYEKLPLILSAVWMAAAALVNPYGIDGLLYTFRSYGPELTFISEMNPVKITNLIGMVYFSVLFLTGLLFYATKGRRIRISHFLLVLGTGYMAASAVRHAGLFLLVLPLVFAGRMGDKKLLSFIEDPLWKKKMVVNTAVFCIVLICAAKVTLAWVWNPYMNTTDHLAGVTEYMTENVDREGTVLYTDYNTGGYLEYLGYRCYIDPRAEVFLEKINKKEDIISEFVKIAEGKADYKDFVEKYQFTHLLVESDAPLRFSLKHDGEYREVYEDEEYCLYEKR